MKSELHLAELQVVNDFEAAALAVPGLGMGDLMRIGPNEPLANKPKLLVGPGTSFGAATIVPVAEKWIVLPSEAMELPMGLSQHKDIIAYMHDRFGSFRIGHFLSGDGFAQIHEAVRVARHRLEPAEVPIVAPEVMAAAKAGDPVAKDAAAVFVQILGHVAGSFAMTPMALGGVYLTGGVTDAIRSAGLLDDGLFRQAFERQGVKGIESRTRLLETIATHAVTASDLGMLGLRTLLGPAHAAAGFRSTPKAAIASLL